MVDQLEPGIQASMQASQASGTAARPREEPAMAMERYRREIEAIERERINFLNKIDLVQPSFEEQHQLEVRQHHIR